MATILVADDQPGARDKAARVLREAGYKVTLANDGQEALERWRAEPPDVAVLDVLMPRMSGVELVRILKGNVRDALIPVILVSSKSDLEARVGGLRAGADDFVAKPYDGAELVARVEAMLRIKLKHEELVRTVKTLEASAIVDPQTGLYNQRFLERRLPEEFARAQRYDDPLALLFIEVEGARGNLRAAGEALAKVIRTVDLLARTADSGLALLLPSTHFAGALPVTRRIHAGLAKIGSSGSIGAAFFPSKQVATADDLLRQAQLALERARQEGTGWVCLQQHQSYLYRPEAE